MILGPTARPFVVLGGEFARSVRRRGELVLAFQYVNTEPAMVIWSGTRQAGAFAICLSVAHEYLDDKHLVFQAMAAAQQIGYHPSDKSVVGNRYQQALIEPGQAPLVFNEVKPTIDWIIGTERRTRVD